MAVYLAWRLDRRGGLRGRLCGLWSSSSPGGVARRCVRRCDFRRHMGAMAGPDHARPVAHTYWTATIEPLAIRRVDLSHRWHPVVCRPGTLHGADGGAIPASPQST